MCSELAVSERGDVPLVAIATLVGWLVCAVVGVLGLVVGYEEPAAIVKAVSPTPVEAIQVDVAAHAESRAAEKVSAPTDGPPMPAAPALMEAPPAPAVVAVTTPSPAISFALPVAGMTHLVMVGEASHGNAQQVSAGAKGNMGTSNRTGAGSATSSADSGTGSGTGVKHLTLGEGEGRQPAPEYPRQAVIARQEGTVGIEFEVDEGGAVTDARITISSRWPLLNQAALHAVKQRWKFSPGARRSYDVLIQFQLEQ